MNFFFKNSKFIVVYDEKKWSKKILKVYWALIYLEKNKYLEPFFSAALDNLVDRIKKAY